MKSVPVAGLGVAIAVFAVDQAIKYWVTGPLGLDQEGAYRTIAPFFDLRFVTNVGISLGLLRADSGAAGWLLDHLTTCGADDLVCRQDAVRWALVALTGAIALGVAIWLPREPHRHDQAALGMILGGAIGNILDRARLGYVVDFADLHFGAWRPFLVFNVADAAITIGVLVLLARALLIRNKLRGERGAEPAPVENLHA